MLQGGKLSKWCTGSSAHKSYYLLTGFLCGTPHALQEKKITPKCPNVNIYQNRHLISRCILMSTTVLWRFTSNLKQVARQNNRSGQTPISWHYCLLLYCYYVELQSQSITDPDLLAKGCSADAAPALFWIRYSRIFTCWLGALKLAQEAFLYFSFLLIFTCHHFHWFLNFFLVY